MNLRQSVSSFLGITLLLSPLSTAAGDVKKKEEAVASIEKRKAELTRMSDQIWSFAETALRETRSSKLLADYAEAQGFSVQRGVAGMPTAFVASYGSGKPVIGILGEYDALPGISQKVSPAKEALEAGAPGHGCGHNLLGVASLGAAVAVKEQIAAGKLRGTVRYFGTPAEEAIGGKLYMLREGLFRDVDIVLAWHPGAQTNADTEGSLANVSFIVEFFGKTAHAAADPWNGRSAVHGMELFAHGMNLMREHVKPTVRIHYAIEKGGDVPNVVPDYARIRCLIRDLTQAGVEDVFSRARKIADGAALMADIQTKLTVDGGYANIVVNLTGEKLLHSNLQWLGPLQYSADEQEFARAIQRATGKESKGLDGSVQALKEQPTEAPRASSDVGDVSWAVPTVNLNVTTAPVGTPWHAWPVVASSGMSIGHKGMIFAAKALAATAVDLFEDAAARDAIRAEFDQKTKGLAYKSYIPAGPPPAPK
ncbi:MAG TPA: amidohydrolase [Candidatus Acidoferrales bacterium]|nr:amidohydrolase [Candidatus Acidoferrales bacterium]